MGRPDAKKAGGPEPSHKETEALLSYRDWLLRAFGFRFERFLLVFAASGELSSVVRFFASLCSHWLEPSAFFPLAIVHPFVTAFRICLERSHPNRIIFGIDEAILARRAKHATPQWIGDAAR